MASNPKSLDAWSGEFGDRYTQRNAVTAEAVSGRARVWGQVLPRLAGDPPASILEVGPNVGLNLRGLAAVSDAELWGIEPNGAARKQLLEDGVLPAERLFEGFGHTIPLADGAVDMAFTSGVLIHVDPSQLEATMREIHRVSAKYVFCAEYFSPKPETITYRGEQDLLFKNDFGSLYLDLFPDLVLVDCGFFWRRTTVMDDTTWWLFRKV
ncbi:pseudaminic acid biosynthesis-associated methylase [Caulobacter sp.]|uniref:pseudaminic acid biosynthesis-associated methylase n=1 Tax=Caulobacter sp. TaxID=78 RepID=UPI001B1F0DBA|nr:pseudaminic acid biosynthesis-associated methylase [Caulobacter sp.]MBO9545382.1 methyltransferase domain-containing protein [Caulobacter sp.]